MIKENLIQYFEESIHTNWDSNALADYKGSSITYGEVANRIARLHLMFERNGIKPGDKVALLGKNSISWAIVYLATISYGAVIVPILPDFRPVDVHHIVNHSDSVVLFVGDALATALDFGQMDNLQAIISLDTQQAVFAKSSKVVADLDALDSLFSSCYPNGLDVNNFTLPKVSNSQLSVISYTSGTTGFSKGVMLALNSLSANIRYARANMPLKSGDNIVSFLPLAHAYGCAFEFLFPFTLGCHITFLTKVPSPQVVVQAFKEVRPRLILSVPLVVEKIYKRQIIPVISKFPTSWLIRIPLLNQVVFKKINHKLTETFGGNFHEIVVGGAAFNAEAETFFRKIKFPCTVGYGMTECGPLISYSSWQTTKPFSTGLPVDTLQVKIDSEDPFSIVGEVLVKGENVMLGYYKNEEATHAVIDEDGWLHTGDLGVLDKEGNIYLKGRSKNMILGASGQNIYPEEIESVLDNKFGVMESLVIMNNGQLHALIFPDFETLESNNIGREEIDSLMKHNLHEVNHQLPSFMKLAKFSIHQEEFEKTPKRSIKRYLYSDN
ncbi:MAG TPA: AMP-binding protein [Williamwhitmania sp.]|nr:AMP-binding protein [Williamwhitmania sp.]